MTNWIRGVSIALVQNTHQISATIFRFESKTRSITNITADSQRNKNKLQQHRNKTAKNCGYCNRDSLEKLPISLLYNARNRNTRPETAINIKLI